MHTSFEKYKKYKKKYPTQIELSIYKVKPNEKKAKNDNKPLEQAKANSRT